MADDVRVKLSAEGIDEIVNAMKKIKAEAEKTGSAGQQYFASWRKEMQGLIADQAKMLTSMVAAGAVVAKFKALSDEVQNTALQVGKLSAATGLSTDALQVYTKAAGKSETAQEALSKGLGFFTRTVGQAEIGSKKAAQGFEEIGIKVGDLAKMSPDQKLQVVADKLVGIQDPAQRAAVGFQMFGKSFQDMYPAILKVHNEGFGPMLDRMKELGIYMDADMINAMRGVKKSMNEIGETSKGMVTQFLTGVLPGISDAMDGIIKSTNSAGVNGFQKLGEWAGIAAKAIVTAMRMAGATVGEIAAEMTVRFQAIGKAIDEIKGNSFGKNLKNLFTTGTLAPKTRAETEAYVAQMKEQLGANIASIVEDWDKKRKTEKPETVPTNVTPIPGKVKKESDNGLAKAQLELVKAQMKAELDLIMAQDKLQEGIDKAAYSQGLIDLNTYYNRRRETLLREGDKELQILRASRAQIAATPVKNAADDVRRRTELVNIDDQIQTKELANRSALQRLDEEERVAKKQGANELLQLQERLLQMEGKRADAARLALQQELDQTRILLQQQGVAADQADQILARMQKAGEAKIQEDSLSSSFSQQMASLQNKKSMIQADVKLDNLFPAQADAQILAMERERLPVLKETAAQLREIAEASGDPAMMQQAEQAELQVKQLEVDIHQLSDAWAGWKEKLQNSFESDLFNFLSDGIFKAKNMKEAFSAMALSIVQDIQKIAAEGLAKQITRWIFSGGAYSLWSGGANIGAAVGAATGGYIRGPGTSTSDSIPARLSDGEFVVNADAVSRPGMLSLLHAINGTPGYSRSSGPSVQAYAQGGLVGGAAGGLNVKVINVPDSSLLADHLDSKLGEQQVLNIIARNPARVRQAL